MIIGCIKNKILADKSDSKLTACQPRWHSDAFLIMTSSTRPQRHKLSYTDVMAKYGQLVLQNDAWRKEAFRMLGRMTTSKKCSIMMFHK